MIHIITDIARTKRGIAALLILVMFLCVALFAPFIASDPALVQEGALAYKAPGFKSLISGHAYLLGTDQIGRDVWAGIVYGTRWALLVGFLATLLSGLIGICFGLLGGYYGDDRIRVNVWVFTAMLIIWLVCAFYIFYSNMTLGLKFTLCLASLFVCQYCMVHISKRLGKRLMRDGSTFYLPFDFLVQRLIEIWRAVPGLFILLALLAAVKYPSLWTLIFILGILRWTGIARIVRAELLHIREQNYIKSAQSLGFSDYHILLKHVLPNVMVPLFVVFAFSVSGAIIMEATISFLGIGMSSDTVTWGSLMSAARQNYRAWWLAVFPGLCIFLLLLSLNIIGDELSN